MRVALLLLALLPLLSAQNATPAIAADPARFGSQPPARVGSVGALTENATVVFFGGVLQSGALAPPDVWEYNPALDRWACLCDSVTQALPPARTGHSANYAQGKLVVYGGRDAADALLRDVWVFDALAGRWAEVVQQQGVQPRPRTGHAAALMPSNTGFMLLAFGGASGTDVLDDVWRLDLAYANATLAGNWTMMRQNSTATSGAVPGLRRTTLALLAAAGLHCIL